MKFILIACAALGACLGLAFARESKLTVSEGITEADYAKIDLPKGNKLTIHGNNNKRLEITFGDKMTVTGDLEYDEAAKRLLDSMGMFYCKGQDHHK